MKVFSTANDSAAAFLLKILVVKNPHEVGLFGWFSFFT